MKHHTQFCAIATKNLCVQPLKHPQNIKNCANEKTAPMSLIVVVFVLTMASSSVEMMGLCSTTNGTSCTAHALCGDHVFPGNVL